MQFFQKKDGDLNSETSKFFKADPYKLSSFLKADIMCMKFFKWIMKV